MVDSIRQLIFDNLVDSIRHIKVGVSAPTSGATPMGYNYSVDDENVVVIRGKRDDSAYKEPVIYLYPSSERLNPEKGEKGYDYNELTIEIEAWIRGEKDEMNPNINKMLSDLKKAIGEDHTRGGYAIDTTFTSNDVFLSDLTSQKAAVLLTIVIEYQHKYALPDEQ